MEHYWLFQANPEKYDIDSALGALDIIHWRVPQYTSQISPGDRVAIWRAGPEAGVVAAGTVLDPPRAAAASEEESRFAVGGYDATEVRTRVAVRVQKAPFVPKAQLATLPSFAGHQILSAPMGTVFPVTTEQWEALRGLLLEPPPISPEQAAAVMLPRTFAWRERRKAMQPLPGGYEGYLASLKQILCWVRDTQPARDDVEAWLRPAFGLAPSSARFVVDFLERLSLVREQSGRMQVGPQAMAWLESSDPKLIVALLHSRVQFIGEMLEYLSQPRTVEQVRQFANQHYSMGWSSRAQIDRRRGWLQSAGSITPTENGGLIITPLGQEILSVLELYQPTPSRAEPSPEIQADVVLPRETVAPETPDSITNLVERLRTTSIVPSEPAAFEQAVSSLFEFLGFDSTWLGGAGKTDVLLVADLGPDEKYRVVVDCKTTGHQGVQDPQIDWITLRDHKERYEADYVAVVGPAFQGTRVSARAMDQGVSLLNVETLVGLCIQHASVPLGLDTYRRLFEPHGGEAGASAVGEVAEESKRWPALAATAVKLLRELETREGPLRARDLYLLLKERYPEQFGAISDQEVASVLSALAAPAIGVLREFGGGYKTLGSLGTAARRLDLLAGQIRQALSPDDRA